MLRVFNTLTKNKEPFETVQPGRVGMYLCGPTVYKPSHIGHMVGPVIFDAIKRYLVYSGYQVTWVVNITDVDDKLINESNARGMPMATPRGGRSCSTGYGATTFCSLNARRSGTDFCAW